MVYQKNIEFKQVHIYKENVTFIKSVKEFIFALDREHNAVIKYLSAQKESIDLQKDFKNTNDAFENLLKCVKTLNLELKVENLDYDIDKIKALRTNLSNQNIYLFLQ